MQKPFYSVIMPTHRRAELLRRAISSVKANTFTDVEIIVVADDIDKDTFLVAAECLGPADKFVKRTGKNGPAESRNIGMELAEGERILFLDDDDAIQPDFLAKAKTHCDQHPSQVLYTNYRVIEEDRNNPKAETTQMDVKVGDKELSEVYVKNFIHNHTCLYPAFSLKNKKQDAHLASLDDWEFLLNVMSETSFRHIEIDGPVIFKDYVNLGNRRGSAHAANGSMVLIDYLYIYRRRPAPTNELKMQRKELLKKVGFDVPIEWL